MSWEETALSTSSNIAVIFSGYRIYYQFYGSRYGHHHYKLPRRPFKYIWFDLFKVWVAVRTNPANGLFGQAANPGPVRRAITKEEIPGQVAATLTGHFYPYETFEQSWEGYVFKFDRFGTGYYRDAGSGQCNVRFTFPDCPEPRPYNPWEKWSTREEESDMRSETSRRLTSKALGEKSRLNTFRLMETLVPQSKAFFFRIRYLPQL